MPALIGYFLKKIIWPKIILERKGMTRMRCVKAKAVLLKSLLH